MRGGHQDTEPADDETADDSSKPARPAKADSSKPAPPKADASSAPEDDHGKSEPPTHDKPSHAMSLVGKWHGTGTRVIKVKGVKDRISEDHDLSFAIESTGDNKIVLRMDSSNPEDCPLEGKLTGLQGTLKVGAHCTAKGKTTETKLTVRASSLEASPNGITIHVDFDIVISHKKGNKTSKGTATFDATGEPES
jgi:hypothetical protein